MILEILEWERCTELKVPHFSTLQADAKSQTQDLS